MRALLLGIFVLVLASAAPARQATGSSGDVERPEFAPERLEQIVAPIALYPDSLLTQIMMASTYPLEVVQAARWLLMNPDLTGDALDKALQQETWDPSVKALCSTPDVIERMNENLDWTQDLGDAFLGQQTAVMDSVQDMRRKAKEAGNLESGEEQTVTEQEDEMIVVEQTDPEVIYVPTYYPTACYGSWYYPHWYYPPLYRPRPAGALVFGFTVGVVWAGRWGGCRWGRGSTQVNINVNNYNKFVGKTEPSGRRKDVQKKAGSGGKWQHNPEHRKGVGYKNDKVAQKYGASGGNNRVSRDQARGYGDRGTRQSSGPGGSRTSPATRDSGRTAPSTRDSSRTAPATRDSSRTAPSTRDSNRKSSGSNRSAPSNSGRTSSNRSRNQGSSSLSGSRSPKFDNRSSQRGSSSRGSAGSRGAASGGRARGGGGRRGR